MKKLDQRELDWWFGAPNRSSRSPWTRPGRLARAVGLVGRDRVLDSTPLYDAVATMDTVMYAV